MKVYMVDVVFREKNEEGNKDYEDVNGGYIFLPFD